MKNSFTLPSCSYNIVLSKADVNNLLAKGYMIMRPLKTIGIFKSEFGINRETSSHSLTYNDDQTIEPVQFVSVVLEE